MKRMSANFVAHCAGLLDHARALFLRLDSARGGAGRLCHGRRAQVAGALGQLSLCAGARRPRQHLPARAPRRHRHVGGHAGLSAEISGLCAAGPRLLHLERADDRGVAQGQHCLDAAGTAGRRALVGGAGRGAAAGADVFAHAPAAGRAAGGAGAADDRLDALVGGPLAPASPRRLCRQHVFCGAGLLPVLALHRPAPPRPGGFGHLHGAGVADQDARRVSRPHRRAADRHRNLA